MKIDKEIKEDLLKYINNVRHNLKNTLDAVDKLERILTAYSFEPCVICKRRVPSPCNTTDNYMESGPWDYACEAKIFPKRFVNE